MLRNHSFHYVSGPVLQATLQEVYAVERKLHIHRQRELLSDPPRWARGRGPGIWGIWFENHHLSRENVFEATEKSTYKTRWNKCDGCPEAKSMEALTLLRSASLFLNLTLLPLFCGGALLNWGMVVSTGAPDTLVSHAWPKAPLLILYLARPSVQYRLSYLHSFVCLWALLVHSCAFTCIYSFLCLSVCLPAHSDFCLCSSIRTCVSVSCWFTVSFYTCCTYLHVVMFVDIVWYSYKIAIQWFIHSWSHVSMNLYSIYIYAFI